MNRIDIINSLIEQHNYRAYLEIGVRFKRDCFDVVRCDTKISVDPSENDAYDFKMTSDEFFAQNTQKFDIVFIDGLHSAEQAFTDVINALACLNTGGTIVMHDCSPPDEHHTNLGLCGTVWKAVQRLRLTRDDLQVCTVDTDYGVGVVQRGAGEHVEQLNPFYDYHIMAENRQKLLGLISVADFRQRFLGR